MSFRKEGSLSALGKLKAAFNGFGANEEKSPSTPEVKNNAIFCLINKIDQITKQIDLKYWLK